jgi:hypothetical protein
MTASLNHDWQDTSEIGAVSSALFRGQERKTYIRKAYGTMGEAITATPTMMTHDTIQTSQKRFHMAGHSLKKWDSSTSLTVEDHCMLYPVKWARSAVVKCHERPQKKKEKKMTHCQVSISQESR